MNKFWKRKLLGWVTALSIFSSLLPLTAFAQYGGNANIMLTTDFDSYCAALSDLYQDYPIEKNPSLFSDETKDFQTKRLIVKAAGTIDTKNADKVLKGYQDRYILQYNTVNDTIQAYNTYQTAAGVKWVEPDKVVTFDAFEPSFQSDDSVSNLVNGWGLKQVQIDTYIDYLLNNQGPVTSLPEIKVAVVDSGLDMDHPFFNGRIASGEKDFYSGQPMDDTNGHGTHVSGIIAGGTNSLTNVKILPLRTFGKEADSGTVSAMCNAIDYAVEQKADVINISAGSEGFSDALEESVQKAYDQKIPIIAAAGNDGKNANYYAPAGIEQCITVSWVGRDLLKAESSNYGACVDLAAPGTSIYSTLPGGTYGNLSGTSMAAPHVTAAVAALKSTDQSLSPDDINAILTSYADDQGTPGKDRYTGAGTLQMANIKQLSPVPSEPLIQTESGNGTFTVSISNPADGTVYYTTDGSDPSQKQTPYNGAFEVSENTRIKAVVVSAADSNLHSNIVQTAIYVNDTEFEDAFEITPSGSLIDYSGSISALTIPEKINGITVTSIGPNGVFRKASSLEKIILPETIKTINASAFYKNTSLQSIDAPGAELLGDYAFFNCSGLESMNLPKLTGVPYAAFYQCASLKEVNLPVAENIGELSFTNASALQTALIPNATTIARGAFANCNEIKELDLSSVTTIGEQAFWPVIHLEWLALPSTLSSMDSGQNFPNPNLVVYGTAGGAAQNFAAERGLTFHEAPFLLKDLPSVAAYNRNEQPKPLSADIIGFHKTYQWYSSTDGSWDNAIEIDGAAEKEYIPSTAALGDTFYAVKVTSTDNSVSTSVQSGFTKISVSGNLSSNALLSGLSYAVGQAPAKNITDFTPETTSYHVSLPSATSPSAEITLSGKSQDSNATIETTSVSLNNGTAAASLTVTSEDGNETKTYVVSFTIEQEAEKAFAILPATVDGLMITVPFQNASAASITASAYIAVYSEGQLTGIHKQDLTLSPGEQNELSFTAPSSFDRYQVLAWQDMVPLCPSVSETV